MEGQPNATSHLSNTKRKKRGIDLAEGETNVQKPKKEYEIILDAFRPHLSFRLHGSKLEIIDAHNPKHFRIIDIPEELLHSVQEFLEGSMHACVNIKKN